MSKNTFACLGQACVPSQDQRSPIRVCLCENDDKKKHDSNGIVKFIRRDTESNEEKAHFKIYVVLGFRDAN